MSSESDPVLSESGAMSFKSGLVSSYHDPESFESDPV